ncbi:MAG: ankyrin repeat domain-containing protein, partial [Thermoproteus sp.]
MALCGLVYKGDLVFKEALEGGANPDVRCSDEGETPLHIVAGYGYVGKVELLLQHGASPNVRTRHGDTPLHYAVCNSKANNVFDVVKVLLAGGADVNVRNIDGRTPLHCAAERGFMSTVKALLDKGA